MNWIWKNKVSFIPLSPRQLYPSSWISADHSLELWDLTFSGELRPSIYPSIPHSSMPSIHPFLILSYPFFRSSSHAVNSSISHPKPSIHPYLIPWRPSIHTSFHAVHPSISHPKASIPYLIFILIPRPSIPHPIHLNFDSSSFHAVHTSISLSHSSLSFYFNPYAIQSYLIQDLPSIHPILIP